MSLGQAFRAFFAALRGEKALPPGSPAPEPFDQDRFAKAVAAQTLGLFQAEGRLLDFLSEDISGYSDEDVGQVVRDVHRGCKRALEDHFRLEPVRSEAENAQVTVPEGFAPTEIRVTGSVVGTPPFTGTLKHGGYRALEVRLPRLRTDEHALVVTPAEVEL